MSYNAQRERALCVEGMAAGIVLTERKTRQKNGWKYVFEWR
jgi:hypothetical protein